MLLVSWIEIRASDLLAGSARNVTDARSLHDSYSGLHLHIVVVFHRPATSLAEKQTHATNYCANSGSP